MSTMSTVLSANNPERKKESPIASNLRQLNEELYKLEELSGNLMAVLDPVMETVPSNPTKNEPEKMVVNIPLANQIKESHDRLVEVNLQLMYILEHLAL